MKPSPADVLDALGLVGRERLAAAEALLERYRRAALVAGDGFAPFCVGAVDRTPAVLAVERWDADLAVGRAPTIAALSAPNGHGKTVAAVRWAAQHGGYVLLTTRLDREGYTGGEPLRMAHEAAHLVIDNLGSEDARSRARTLIVGLILERDFGGLPTLITTTLPMSSRDAKHRTLTSEYPDSIVSRLTDCVFDVGGKDRRQRGGAPDAGLAEARALLDAQSRATAAVRHASNPWPEIVVYARALGVDDALDGEEITATENGRRVLEAVRAAARVRESIAAMGARFGRQG